MGMIGPPEVWCKHCGHLSPRYTEYCSQPACQEAERVHKTLQEVRDAADRIARGARLQKLQDFFHKEIVEDPVEGSDFDCDVIAAIETLKKKYGPS